ncbi:MAG: endo-1,4-beta-xylanase [Prevotellaceae bacterium]|jgi:GH35 family endo-1,4-beta-xylanase|nr:endo-1,4-beta-xylanase [Prevotellaceae bacterium]
MKHLSYILGAFLITTAALTSCADNTPLSFEVTDKPTSIADMEYLNNYDALKSYVDRTTNPNFKLGTGVDVNDYNTLGYAYRVSNTNFDEVTAGNAMKYGSVVKDNGTMIFDPVETFVKTAKAAGVSIYGHTLVWHAQQNLKYLKSLIADKPVEGDSGTEWVQLLTNGDFESSNVGAWLVNNSGSGERKEGTGVDGSAGFAVTNPTAQDLWSSQFVAVFTEPAPIGAKYKYSFKVRADVACNVHTQGHSTVGTMMQWSPIPDLPVTTEWQTFEGEATVTGTEPWQAFVFDLGGTATTYYFDDMSIEYEKQLETSWWENIVTNSDCESNDRGSYTVAEGGGAQGPPTFSGPGTGADGIGRAIVVKSGASHVNTWDTQFFVTVDHVFEAGEGFHFSMKMKADKNVTLEAQAHNGPGGYLHWSIVGSPSVTTEWQEYTYNGTVPDAAAGMNTIAFNLAMSDNTTYYFDDIIWEIERTGGIPLTPEEKADTLTWAMNNWISGMMIATDGYVTAWDVVNEPLSGADSDGDGLYDLQSASNGDAKNNFYWQDYLGPDYVRIAVKSARENSTVPLKLFVNDYNLESDWDDNGKLKSLIEWIKRWESDGITQIDGIGTQMHVSYYLNPTVQASKEAAITKMFELLASSGKLIKISELDMGIVDANGNDIMTPDVTDEQARGMAKFYNFIIKEYFRLIPANQRYGITQWASTDSPTDSGWRAGQPIGLWTTNYSTRKHTYGGFADGLAGVDYPSKQ